MLLAQIVSVASARPGGIPLSSTANYSNAKTHTMRAVRAKQKSAAASGLILA
jgi:hypothetical protein